MNIRNLQLNYPYKWKQLCETLEIKVSEGNSRKRDIKILESHCKFRKEGQKFIIEEIYDMQKRIPNKKKDNSINSLMSSAIMYKLVNTEEGFLCGGINNWLFEIGIVKSEFVKRNQRMFKTNSKDDTFEEDDFLTAMDKDFISIEYSSLRYHFISALEKIRKTKLADYYITCKVGLSVEGKTVWTRELDDDELKLLRNEKDKLYKEFGILNEFDLLYGNDKLEIERDLDLYNIFRKKLRNVLRENFNANFEYTAYKVILKNTSEIAFKKIDMEFFEGYDLAFLKNSIYVKRRKSAEKRQQDAIDKYRVVEGNGSFFDNTNQLYIDNLNLKEVDKNKVNGIYVDLWDKIYKELIG